MLSRQMDIAHRHIAVNIPSQIAHDENHPVTMTG